MAGARPGVRVCAAAPRAAARALPRLAAVGAPRPMRTPPARCRRRRGCPQAMAVQLDDSNLFRFHWPLMSDLTINRWGGVNG
jgi:hypothetical protein